MDATFAMLLCSELKAPDCPVFSKTTASTVHKNLGTRSTLVPHFPLSQNGIKGAGL